MNTETLTRRIFEARRWRRARYGRQVMVAAAVLLLRCCLARHCNRCCRVGAVVVAGATTTAAVWIGYIVGCAAAAAAAVVDAVGLGIDLRLRWLLLMVLLICVGCTMDGSGRHIHCVSVFFYWDCTSMNTRTTNCDVMRSISI